MSFQFRSVNIFFEVGDIFTSDVDAICISTTSRLDLTVGAGKALKRVLGGTLDSILNEERRKITNSTGVVIINGGEVLNNKKIMFAIIRGSDVGFLYEIYGRIFERAIQEGFRSIAMTAIGAGNLHAPLSYVSSCAFTALNRINNFGSLKKIYFKDIRERTISVYRRKFRRLLGNVEEVPTNEVDEDNEEDEEAVDEVENIESTSMTTLTDSDKEKLEEDDRCAICLCNFFESDETVVKLKLCRHIYHQECTNEAFKTTQRCPLCLKIYVTSIGPQPPGGKMVSRIVSGTVPGFPDANGFIEIKYKIPSGIQSEQHVRPGLPFMGVTRVAYLPNTEEGAKCLKLLEVAFKMRCTFTVSDSLTTGRRNICVWNGIHHKTSKDGGEFGYPDSSYLHRLQYELRNLGITEELLG